MTPDRVSPSLPPMVRCKAISVRYEIDPFLHCVLELHVEDTQFQLAEMMDLQNEEQRHNVATMDATRLNQIFSLDAEERKIVVRYHPSDFPDYLVLFSRFRQSLSRGWQSGQRYLHSFDRSLECLYLIVVIRFQMLFEGETEADEPVWHQGVIEELHLSEPAFPWECLQVRWDSARHVEYVSPWEIVLLANDSPQFSQIESVSPSVTSVIADRIQSEALLICSVLCDSHPVLIL